MKRFLFPLLVICQMSISNFLCLHLLRNQLRKMTLALIIFLWAENCIWNEDSLTLADNSLQRHFLDFNLLENRYLSFAWSLHYNHFGFFWWSTYRFKFSKNLSKFPNSNVWYMLFRILSCVLFSRKVCLEETKLIFLSFFWNFLFEFPVTDEKK